MGNCGYKPDLHTGVITPFTTLKRLVLRRPNARPKSSARDAISSDAGGSCIESLLLWSVAAETKRL